MPRLNGLQLWKCTAMVEDKIQFLYRHFHSDGQLCLEMSHPTFCASTQSSSSKWAANQQFGAQKVPVKLAALTLGTDTTLHFRKSHSPAPPLHGTSLNNAPGLKLKHIMALCFCHHQDITPVPMSFTWLFYQVWRMLMWNHSSQQDIYLLHWTQTIPLHSSAFGDQGVAQVFFITQVNRKFFTFQVCIRGSCY